jgi:hypothetical protein
LALSPGGEFQWIEIDPDRVAWTAPAFPEEEGADGRFDHLAKKASLIEVSPARNALYYEVDDTHYVFDLESGRVARVTTAGPGTRFVAFSQEGDTVCLRAPRYEDRYEVLLLVAVADGAATPVSWAGTPIYLSSASDLAVTNDHTMLRGFSLKTPGAALWQSAPTDQLAYVTPDGSTFFSALGPVSRFSWARLDPRTGPEKESTVPLQSVQGPGEWPELTIDPQSRLAAWSMGYRVEVFWIRNLGTDQAGFRVYDLGSAF